MSFGAGINMILIILFILLLHRYFFLHPKDGLVSAAIATSSVVSSANIIGDDEEAIPWEETSGVLDVQQPEPGISVEQNEDARFVSLEEYKRVVAENSMLKATIEQLRKQIDRMTSTGAVGKDFVGEGVAQSSQNSPAAVIKSIQSSVSSAEELSLRPNDSRSELSDNEINHSSEDGSLILVEGA